MMQLLQFSDDKKRNGRTGILPVCPEFSGISTLANWKL